MGLDFISKLIPVSYTRKNDENKKKEYALIAQELEEILKEFNVENFGMLTIDYNGYYNLRYNDLLAPMIKSIKELVNEIKPAGSHIVYWNSDDDEGRKVSSGVYVYKLVAGDLSASSGQVIQIKKMSLVR